MSNFTEVSRMNEMFGNRKNSSEIGDKQCYKQFDLIQEELDELFCAIEIGDIKEARDAISDILVTTYGMAHILGVDADADMKVVQESNLSKLCEDPEECNETMEYYYTIGVHVHMEGDYPEVCVKSSKDQAVGGKFYPKGKFLKSIAWKEPRFD